MFCNNVNEKKKTVWINIYPFHNLKPKKKSQVGLKEVFDESIRCVLFNPKKSQKKPRSLLQRFLPFLSSAASTTKTTKTISPSQNLFLKNSQFTWIKINNNKIAQSAIRYGHISASTNDKIIVLGGVDDKGMICKSILEFDIENESWKEVDNQTDESFNGALFAASATVGSKIYIFGGRSNGYRKELFEFSSFFFFEG